MFMGPPDWKWRISYNVDCGRLVVGANCVRAGSDSGSESTAVTNPSNLFIVHVDGRSKSGALITALAVNMEEAKGRSGVWSGLLFVV
jgi:hypothetical protein